MRWRPRGRLLQLAQPLLRLRLRLRLLLQLLLRLLCLLVLPQEVLLLQLLEGRQAPRRQRQGRQLLLDGLPRPRRETRRRHHPEQVTGQAAGQRMLLQLLQQQQLLVRVLRRR